MTLFQWRAAGSESLVSFQASGYHAEKVMSEPDIGWPVDVSRSLMPDLLQYDMFLYMDHTDLFEGDGGSLLMEHDEVTYHAPNAVFKELGYEIRDFGSEPVRLSLADWEYYRMSSAPLKCGRAVSYVKLECLSGSDDLTPPGLEAGTEYVWAWWKTEKVEADV